MKFLKNVIDKINTSVQEETVLTDSKNAVVNSAANVVLIAPAIGLAGLKTLAKSVNKRSEKICDWVENKETEK